MRSATRSCLKGQWHALYLIRPISGVWASLGDPVPVMSFAGMQLGDAELVASHSHLKMARG